MKKIQRKYGWIPDLPDVRDFTYKVAAPTYVPEKVDLRSYCSTVEDQGRLGSCTANACAGNIEFLERKGDELQPVVKMTWWQRILAFFGLYRAPYKSPRQWKDASRLYIYYNARVLNGTADQDSGAYIRDCMKTLAKQGHCLESIWPYDVKKFSTKPSPEAYVDGYNNVISHYIRLTTLNDMLTCLADGFPFVMGITLYDSFESDDVAKTGVVNMPDISKERVIGGHAVMCVGYDQATKRFLVRNSWGPDWGMDGYFTIPYEYVTSLGDDFWTIRK